MATYIMRIMDEEIPIEAGSLDGAKIMAMNTLEEYLAIALYDADGKPVCCRKWELQCYPIRSGFSDWKDA